MCVTVICKAWRLVNGAIITGSYQLCVKWSMNPISNPKPLRESLMHVTILLYLPDCLLEVSTRPAGPATGHLDNKFLVFLSLDKW
jgi:hypothetical protein